MRGKSRTSLIFPLILGLSLAASCGDRASDIADLRESRYDLRAYEGAPPIIPHGIEDLGRQSCLSCHRKGNARKFNRIAPVTPHPEQINCRQCHVPRAATGHFVETTFNPFQIVGTTIKSNPLGPPYIPHRLQDRQDCRSCHLSDSTPSELRPGHGDRTNCTQCHVPQKAGPPLFSKAQERKKKQTP